MVTKMITMYQQFVSGGGNPEKLVFVVNSAAFKLLKSEMESGGMSLIKKKSCFLIGKKVKILRDTDPPYWGIMIAEGGS